jgi:hypothetical protein
MPISAAQSTRAINRRKEAESDAMACKPAVSSSQGVVAELRVWVVATQCCAGDVDPLIEIPVSGQGLGPEPEQNTDSNTHAQKNHPRARGPILNSPLIPIPPGEEHALVDDGARS